MTGPLRVLHIHSGNMLGGIETMLLTFAESSSDPIRHSFAICFPGSLQQALQLRDARLSMLQPVRFSRPWTVARARRALQDVLDEEQPDVSICHSLWSWSALGPAIVRSASRAVLWLHAPLVGAGWLERLAHRTRPDFVICNSEFTRSSLPGLFPHMASAVVHPPVRPDEGSSERGRAEVRRRLAAGPDVIVIVQVSRLEPWKGQEALLNALGDLIGLENWMCWQVGTPQSSREASFLTSLRRRARELAIEDRVRFEIDVTNVRHLLAAADIFCQPNVEPEPFGIAFVEAMYAGLPVVACATGGALEVVDSTCGVLVPPADTAALSTALRHLVLQRGLRTALGRAGRHKAQSLCHPDLVAGRLASILLARGTVPGRGS